MARQLHDVRPHQLLTSRKWRGRSREAHSDFRGRLGKRRFGNELGLEHSTLFPFKRLGTKWSIRNSEKRRSEFLRSGTQFPEKRRSWKRVVGGFDGEAMHPLSKSKASWECDLSRLFLNSPVFMRASKRNTCIEMIHAESNNRV